MTTPPFLVRVSGPPPSWRRWLLSALYNFDRHTIYDWAGLMAGHLRRPDGVTAMRALSIFDAAAWPVQGLIRHFRPEIERRINEYTRDERKAA